MSLNNRQATQAAIIDIAAEHRANELNVTVSDAGPGLTVHRDSPGLGLGLAIIIQTADAVSLDTSPSGGLRVQMRFVADRTDS